VYNLDKITMAVIVSMDTSLESEVSKLFQIQKETSINLRTSTAKERIAKLNKMEQWIHTNRTEIQKAIYEDFKKPEEEVDLTEIYPVIMDIKYTRDQLKKWMKAEKVDAPLSMLGSRPYIQYEPKGTCLIIAPWNYPFNLLLGPLVSAIAAGNTVFLKPSEMTPNTSALMANMIDDLYDKHEIVLFEGGIQLSTALLKLPFDHIFYTGSPAIGKVVMKAAAENLTSVTLELGGKSPAIVDKTANIKASAQKLAWGKLINAGQTCVSPDFLMVDKSVEKEIIQELIKSMDKQFGKGNGQYKYSHSYARIVNKDHHQRISNLIEDAVNKGAEVVYSGEMDKKQNFISPTILTGITEEMDIANEEIFGPILPIFTYESLNEAIDYINRKPKPLALYIFSKSRKNIKQVLNNTSSGSACSNDCVVQFGQNHLPFGGVNNSGIGKAHGIYGFKAFSNEKAVIRQLPGKHLGSLIYPPYTHFSKKLIDLLLKYIY
jgi:aldehyde dehydrogenase (NAD+)